MRSARCGSIASGPIIDHISAQAADAGTCQSNLSYLASSGHIHETPASTAARNASGNLAHVHLPEAKYPDMMNGNVGGPFIQAPSGPRMLYKQDDRLAPTTNEPKSSH